MTLESIRDYCLAKNHVSEDMPFGDNVLAMRVGGKIFLLCNIEEVPVRVNLKCDPDRALLLRDTYPDVIPGYHMNKKHWNTVYCNGELKESLIRDMIDHSYELIVHSLPRKVKQELFGE